MSSIRIDIEKLLQDAKSCLQMADKLEEAAHCLTLLQKQLSPSETLTKNILLQLGRLQSDLQNSSVHLKRSAAILKAVAEIFIQTEENILQMVKSLPCEDIFSRVNFNSNLAPNVLKRERFLINSPVQSVSSSLISNHILSHSDWLIQMIIDMWQDF